MSLFNMDKQEYNFFTLFVFYGMAIGGGAALIYGLFFKIDVSNLEVMECCYENRESIFGSKTKRNYEEIIYFNNLHFNEQFHSKEREEYIQFGNCTKVYLITVDSNAGLAQIIHVPDRFERKMYVPIAWLQVLEGD